MKTIIDAKILSRALIVGVVIELILVAIGHARPQFKLHYGLFGAMVASGTAGLLYGRDLARGFAKGALGGLAIGAACGVAAVGLSNVLGDEPRTFLPYGVMVLTLTGCIGGLFGQLDAWMRAFLSAQNKN
jgi:hypothetical protein